MDNWDKFQKNLEYAADAQGTLNDQQEIYMESIAAHINQLKASKEEIFGNLIDEDFIKGVVDTLNVAAQSFNGFITSFGGGLGAFAAMGSVVATIFNKQIVSGIQSAYQESGRLKDNVAILNTQLQTVQAGIVKSGSGGAGSAISEASAAGLEKQVQLKRELLDIDKRLSNEQRTELNNQITKIANLQEEYQMQLALKEDRYDETVIREKISKLVREIDEQTAKGVTDNTKLKNELNEQKKLLEEIQTMRSRVGGRTEVDTKAALDAELATYANMKQGAMNAANLTSVVSGLTSSLSSLAMVYSSVNTLMTTWSDKNKSIGEKLSQTFMTLGFTIPLVARSVNTLSKALGAEMTIMEALNKAKRFKIVTEQVEVVNLEKQAAKERILAAIKAKRSHQDKVGGIIKKGQLKDDAALLGITEKTTTAEVEGIVVTETKNEVTKKEIALQEALNKTLLGNPYVLAAAAIAALVAVIVWWIKRTKEIKENTEKLGSVLNEQLTDAKSKYDELKSSIDSLKESEKTLKNLTKGTTEWKEAVIDLNTQVMDLIDKYPELASMVDVLDGGVYHLSDEALDSVLNSQLDKLKNAQIDALSGSIISNNAKLSKEIERVNPYYASMDNDNMQKEYKSYLDAFEKYGSGIFNKDFLSNNKLEDDALLQELTTYDQETLDSLKEVCDLIKENNVKNEKAFEEQIKIGLQDNKAYEALSESQKESIKGLVEGSIKQATENNTDTKEALEDFLKDKYGDDAKISKRAGAWTVKDSEGNVLLEKVSDESVRQLKEMNNIIGGLNDSFSTYKNTLDSIIEKVGEDQSNAVTSFIGGKDGDLTSLTKGQIDELGPESEAEAYQNFIDALVNDIGLTKDEAISALDAAVSNINERIENITEGLTNTVISAFDDIDKSDMTIEMQESIRDVLQKAFIYGGQEGLESTQNLLDFFQKNGELKEFSKAVAGMDFGATSYKEFTKALEENGVTTKITKEAYDLLALSTSNAIKSLDGFSETVEKVGKVLKNLKSVGDTISAEDFSELSSLDSELSSFFTKQLDGSYKLNRSAQELKDTVEQIYTNKVAESNNSLYKAIDSIENVKGYDFDTLSQSQTQHLGWGQIVGSYNETAQQQIELLKVLNRENDEELARLALQEEKLQQGNLNVATEIANQVKESKDQFEGLAQTQELLVNQITQNYIALAEQYDNFKDLKEAYEGGMFGEDSTIATNAYNTAAAQLDAQLDTKNLDVEKWESYAETLRECATAADGFNEEMSKDEARIVAKGIMKMNQAIDTLADSFVATEKNTDSWYDILKKSSVESEEYATAMYNTKQAVADLLDISAEYVSSDFINAHLDDITKAATGSEEAIDSLKASLSEDIVLQITGNFEGEALDLFNQVQTTLDEKNLTIGASLDDEEFLNTLNQMIALSGMTVDEVQALFDSMGYEPEINTQEVLVPSVTTRQRIERSVVGIHKNDIGIPDGFIMEESVTPLEPVESDSYITAYGINGSPKVKSLTKKAPAKANNYSSVNKGGKKPGKSSGSSKSDKSKSEKEKVWKDEFDQFKQLQQAIDKTSSAMDHLNNIEEHLGGKELIKSLKQQNDLLKVQANNYKALYDAKKKYAESLQADLKYYGFTFDADGGVTNYIKQTQAVTDKMNSYVQQYNAGKIDENEYKKQEAIFDDVKKKLEEYIDLYSKELPSLIEEYYDAIQEEADNQLLAFTTELELYLDLDEAKRDWNDFIKDINKDITLHVEEIDINLFDASDALSLIQKDMKSVEDAMRKVWSEREKLATTGYQEGMMFTTVSDAEEKYKELADTYKDLVNDAKDIWDDSYESYLDLIDQYSDRLDELHDKYELINDQLDMEKDLLDMVYGEQAYNDLSKVYQAQAANQQAQIKGYKSEYEMWKSMYEAAAEGSKEQASFYEKMTEAQKNLQSTLKDYISTLKEDLTNTFKQTVRDIQQVIYGANDLTKGGLIDFGYGVFTFDEMQEQWETAKKQADMYYDSIEKIYQLNSLQQKYLDAINDSDNQNYQRELTLLMEEQIEMLKNKENLSETDVQLAEKRLEIAKAQMELDNANSTKNQMKLTRDAAGNYVYSYVADNSAVNEKKKALQDSVNELYELSKQAYRDSVDTAFEIQQEYFEKYDELVDRYAGDEESLRRHLEALNSQYAPLFRNTMNDANDYYDTFGSSTSAALMSYLKESVENYDATSEEMEALTQELNNANIESWSDFWTFVDNGTLELNAFIKKALSSQGGGMQYYWNTALGNMSTKWRDTSNNIEKTMAEALEKVVAATLDYQDKTSEALENIGTNWDDFGESVGDVKDAIEEVEKAQQDLVDSAADIIPEMLDNIRDIESAWQDVKESVYDNGDAIEDLTTKIGQAITKANQLQSSLKAAASSSVNVNYSAGSGSGSGGTDTTQSSGGSTPPPTPGQGPLKTYSLSLVRSDGKTLALGDIKASNKDMFYDSLNAALFNTDSKMRTTIKNQFANGGSHLATKEIELTYPDGKTQSADIFRAVKNSNGYSLITAEAYRNMSGLDILKKNFQFFDTGGYTGDWAGDGRVAMLHQKELVLNSTDTSKILDAVELVRSMTTMGSNMLNNISTGIAGVMTHNASSTVQQNIKIEARFPDATQASEIQAAFENLINIAAQRANS